MATIDISRSHALPLEEAKKRAEELAKGMETKLGLVWKWVGDTIDFHAPSGAAKGAKGTVSVSASAVRVEIDLPFMLKMMKGTIESKVNDRLQELLPSASG
jgi:putative polyhydroxyalkanoate system protein